MTASLCSSRVRSPVTQQLVTLQTDFMNGFWPVRFSIGLLSNSNQIKIEIENGIILLLPELLVGKCRVPEVLVDYC
jgi:hypothetical protein